MHSIRNGISNKQDSEEQQKIRRSYNQRAGLFMICRLQESLVSAGQGIQYRNRNVCTNQYATDIIQLFDTHKRDVWVTLTPPPPNQIQNRDPNNLRNPTFVSVSISYLQNAMFCVNITAWLLRRRTVYTIQYTVYSIQAYLCRTFFNFYGLVVKTGSIALQKFYGLAV